MKMMSSGAPLSNTRIRILDEQGREVGDRKVGEIALQSDCMLTDYYNRPDATEKAIINGWFFTGDYGYISEGEVFVSGRKKDMIIVGGRNVYPQDLESLSYEVAGVHAGRSVAFGVFNQEAGTEDVVIVAEVEIGECRCAAKNRRSDPCARHQKFIHRTSIRQGSGSKMDPKDLQRQNGAGCQ